jgi:hypothetical protein
MERVITQRGEHCFGWSDRGNDDNKENEEGWREWQK